MATCSSGDNYTPTKRGGGCDDTKSSKVISSSKCRRSHSPRERYHSDERYYDSQHRSSRHTPTSVRHYRSRSRRRSRDRYSESNSSGGRSPSIRYRQRRRRWERSYSPPPPPSPPPKTNNIVRRGTRENPLASRCIGVFGLNTNTTQQKIRDLFSKFGPIERIQMVIDAHTGRSRGFCFIYFECLNDAKAAKDACSGIEVDDRRIRVDFSITQRAHTPTPGVYMGRPSRYSKHSRERYDSYRPRRRTPSPYYRDGEREREQRPRYERQRERERSSRHYSSGGGGGARYERSKSRSRSRKPSLRKWDS